MIVNVDRKRFGKLITNNTVVPVDAEIQSLALRTWRLVDLRTGCRSVWAGAMSSGSCVVVRAQAVGIRDGLHINDNGMLFT